MEETFGRRRQRPVQRRRPRDAAQEAELRSQLYQEIGQMKVELDWLKKSMTCSLEQRRNGFSPNIRSCPTPAVPLVGPAPVQLLLSAAPESAQNLGYMRLLDEEYTRHPFYGVPRMTSGCRLRLRVGPKRVRRLLRQWV